MPLDKRPTIPPKFQRLRIVLTDQVADARLGVSHPGAQVGCEFPFEFAGRGVNVGVVESGRGLDIGSRGFFALGLGVGGGFGFE